MSHADFLVANRASTGSERDSLAPPPSPYPATVDPSPVESNDSHSTDITDIDQDDLLSPSAGDDPPKSPDIEIMSPMSNRSVEEAAVCLGQFDLGTLGRLADIPSPFLWSK